MPGLVVVSYCSDTGHDVHDAVIGGPASGAGAVPSSPVDVESSEASSVAGGGVVPELLPPGEPLLLEEPLLPPPPPPLPLELDTTPELAVFRSSPASAAQAAAPVDANAAHVAVHMTDPRALPRRDSFIDLGSAPPPPARLVFPKVSHEPGPGSLARGMWYAPRPFRPLAIVVALMLGLLARPAAAGNDAAATKLRHDAIYEDYLQTRFEEAQTKLLKALALCAGAPDCTAATRARLHCDLGIIDYALQKPEDGHAEFLEAVKQDSTVTIDHDLSTPAIERDFAAAGGRARVTDAAPAKADAKPTAKDASADEDTTSDAKGSEAKQGSDCPPGFPGCHDETEKSDESEAAPPPDAPYKRSWVSVALQVEALLLPTAKDACGGGTGYTCFNGGNYYAAQPLASADDVVNGGIRVGTKRVLVGYDRAVSANLTVGGRAGFAFGAGPTRPGGRGFDPVHIEGRATYWFGHDPLGRAGLRFSATAALGYAEVDATVPAEVYASFSAYQAGQAQTLDAWKKTGNIFGSVGLGAMFAFTPDSGLELEVKGMEMFPTTGTALAAQIGYVIGL
jgi:hypothetical protein